MDYKTTVQAWVNADNQMRILGEKMRDLREQKANLSDSLAAFLKSKSLDAIPTTEGPLRLVKRREYEHLTFKFLEKWLPTLLTERSETELILAILKEKRSVKETMEIVRSPRPSTSSSKQI
jgi:hypothetical protein